MAMNWLRLSADINMMFIYNVDLEQLFVIGSRGCEGFSMKEFGKELGETSCCMVCTIKSLSFSWTQKAI